MNDQKNMIFPNRLIPVFLLGYVVLWWFVSYLSSPSLDGYGDMVENYAWGQTWIWGSFKHPPLIAWVVKLWFSVFPTSTASYFLLSYLNATLGLLGIVSLSRLWLPRGCADNQLRIFSFLVLLFAAMSFPYSNLASKFNADTILLSIWPWTTYLFFRAVYAENSKQQLVWSILLGIMGAIAMLGKYYSGVLLVSFVFVTLFCRYYWGWYKTPYPYIAVLVFILCLVPHTLWEFSMDFPFMQYLDGKATSEIHWFRVLKFFLSGIFYFVLTWLLWGFLFKKLSNFEKQTIHLSIPLKPLVLICFLPALITLFFHIAIQIHLTSHWAIPIWFALPILLALILLPYIDDAFPSRLVLRSVVMFAIAILILAIAYTFLLSVKGSAKYTYSRQEMTKSIEERFTQQFPNKVLKWVGGDWTAPAAVAFFSSHHPRAITGMPNEMPGLVNPHPSWANEYGAILCVNLNKGSQGDGINEKCRKKTITWLRNNALSVHEQPLTFRAKGIRFLNAKEKTVIVFWVVPKGENNE